MFFLLSCITDYLFPLCSWSTEMPSFAFFCLLPTELRDYVNTDLGTMKVPPARTWKCHGRLCSDAFARNPPRSESSPTHFVARNLRNLWTKFHFKFWLWLESPPHPHHMFDVITSPLMRQHLDQWLQKCAKTCAGTRWELAKTNFEDVRWRGYRNIKSVSILSRHISTVIEGELGSS